MKLEKQLYMHIEEVYLFEPHRHGILFSSKGNL
jgi:hypothetical protein